MRENQIEQRKDKEDKDRKSKKKKIRYRNDRYVTCKHKRV